MHGESATDEAGAKRGGRSFLRSRTGLALVGFLAVAGFFLLTEHTAHVFGALPFILLLACPLLHLFLHGGHGASHSGHAGTQQPGREAR